MPTGFVYELHKLTRLLDRAADGLLQEQEGLSYARFLTLFAVKMGATSQRDVARRLGQSEPSTSRMVGLLADEGWLDVEAVPGMGHRRELRLTRSGFSTVKRCAAFLETEFEGLMARSGVGRSIYERDTRRLLEQLEGERSPIARSRGAKA